jgi:hypothetical protein
MVYELCRKRWLLLRTEPIPVPIFNKGQFHWHNPSFLGHPSCRNDHIAKAFDLVNGLCSHFVTCSLDLDDGFVRAKYMVAMLEIEAVFVLEAESQKQILDGPIKETVAAIHLTVHIRVLKIWAFIRTGVAGTNFWRHPVALETEIETHES